MPPVRRSEFDVQEVSAYEAEPLAGSACLCVHADRGWNPGLIRDSLGPQTGKVHFTLNQHKYAHGLGLVRSIEEYRASVESNQANALVDLETFIPGIVLDIRYATASNFTGKKVYTMPKAFLRRPAAEILRAVQEELAAEGLGLIVFDAYRPYSATVRFFEILPDPDFCADPQYGSRHNRGCAVDVLLYSLKTGQPLPMPSDYDDFSEKAHSQYAGAGAEAAANRDKLIAVIGKQGFTAYPTEWWHFDFNDWEAYRLMDLSFEELQGQ